MSVFGDFKAWLFSFFFIDNDIFSVILNFFHLNCLFKADSTYSQIFEIKYIILMYLSSIVQNTNMAEIQTCNNKLQKWNQNVHQLGGYQGKGCLLPLWKQSAMLVHTVHVSWNLMLIASADNLFLVCQLAIFPVICIIIMVGIFFCDY